MLEQVSRPEAVGDPSNCSYVAMATSLWEIFLSLSGAAHIPELKQLGLSLDTAEYLGIPSLKLVEIEDGTTRIQPFISRAVRLLRSEACYDQAVQVILNGMEECGMTRLPS
jgi:hypothetical protein